MSDEQKEDDTKWEAVQETDRTRLYSFDDSERVRFCNIRTHGDLSDYDEYEPIHDKCIDACIVTKGDGDYIISVKVLESGKVVVYVNDDTNLTIVK